MKNLYKIILFLFLFNNLFAYNHFEKSSYINTKNITYNEIDNIVELGENSLINFQGSNILINKGIIDYNKDKVEIFGNFYMYQGDSIFSATDLIGNTALTNFKTNKISYLYNDNLKIDAEYSERTNDLLFFYDNYLTPCELKGFFECPTWSMKIEKTKYIISEDQFIHYDSFLQIADKKVFYIPYLSHYGNKAPRKKGFLTPTFDFDVIKGIGSVLLPYYIPLNISNDLLIKPTLNLDDEVNQININSVFTSLRSGGSLSLNMDTTIDNNKKNFYNSTSINTVQNLNKSNQIELNALSTNSISKTRSNNENQINYFNSYLKLNSFDVLFKNDFMSTEVNTITSFDESNESLIPIQSPYIKYSNAADINSNLFLINDISFYILERDNSDSSNPKQNIGLNLTNEFLENRILGKSIINNKLILDNSFRNIQINNESNRNIFHESSVRISSSIKRNIYKNLASGHLKIIINENLNVYKNNIVEDSNSISFNYDHLFKENRLYGYDLSDNSKRLAYGLETNFNINNNDYYFDIGQSYDMKLNNEYLSKVNQVNRLSDIAIKTGVTNALFSFNLGSRINNANYSKKEMDYSFSINNKKWDLLLSYNETSDEAFSENSDNSKALKSKLNIQVNQNVDLSYSTNLDLQNDYYPFSSQLILNLSDECSQFEISYLNTRYSDNFITTPTETISLTYRMDYLGFFGYEQSTDLFFSEAGSYYHGFNY